MRIDTSGSTLGIPVAKKGSGPSLSPRKSPMKKGLRKHLSPQSPGKKKRLLDDNSMLKDIVESKKISKER